MRARRSLARADRGYTAVELLMSVAILALGVTGVVAMQKVTITSNQHAKNLAIATQAAQAWMDQLRADGLSWNHPSARSAADDLDQTIWLQNVPDTGDSGWFRPAWNDARDFGASFDAQGRPADPTGPTPVRFCTHLRLSWLFNPSATTMVGNGLIRAEVRVYWLREGQSGLDNRPVCGTGEVAANIGEAIDRYHFVYNVSAIRQNSID
jgi:type IV pilus assembly protein PilV